MSAPAAGGAGPRPARPSDGAPEIAAFGDGDVAASVLSLSARHADGEDAAYLRWHLLDHLPEQHRLVGLRQGQRWVSTPACRAARAASEPPYDAVDHAVQYLFGEPVQPALDRFFPLGGALRGIGRMPTALPRVQVGGWGLASTVAAERVLVGASVLPWRPATGVYVIIEQAAAVGAAATDVVDPAAVPASLVEVPGVAGAWCWVGTEPRHPWLESTAGLTLTVCYLDADPVEVASASAPVLAGRWAATASSTPVLAAPFELVVAGEWDRHLP